jgi:hypothetical protein
MPLPVQKMDMNNCYMLYGTIPMQWRQLDRTFSQSSHLMLQSKLPPIVLTKRPINSGKEQKYATMEYNVSGKGKLMRRFAMLLKALVVRSTRQKGESLSEDSKKS